MDNQIRVLVMICAPCNPINFLSNTRNRRRIARTSGQAMGRLLRVRRSSFVGSKSELCTIIVMIVLSRFGVVGRLEAPFAAVPHLMAKLNVSRLVLQLSLPNPLKLGVKSRMKM